MLKGGSAGVAKSCLYLLPFIILANLFAFGPVSVLSINSTQNNFTVVPNNISFNWTAGVLNITANVGNITVVVGNASIYTYIRANYSQDDAGLYDSSGLTYSYLNGINYSLCFNASASYAMSFIVKNHTNETENTITGLNTADYNYSYLFPYTFCPPGRYYGNFSVYNATGASDYANVTATIDIPITTNNTLNESDYTGLFRGKLPQYPQTYHYYYLNATLGNATGVTLKLNGSFTDDIDVFLFHQNGTLLSDSVGRTHDEEMADIRLPTSDDRWEIRVYGNTSSIQTYSGWLFFTPLNATNNNSIDSYGINSFDFGVFNATDSTNATNFTVENEASFNLSGVNHFTEIYHVKVWDNGSGGYNTTSTDFTDFFVPRFAQSLKVKVEWIPESSKNITNWTMELRDNTGALINRSQSKYLNANMTNGTRAEYIIFSGPFNSTNEGFWNITVANYSNGSLSKYNVTAYIWMNESQWINVTLANGSVAQSLSMNNYNPSYNLTANLTLPNSTMLNGSYGGFIQFNNSMGWRLRVPLSFDVDAGMLTINNAFNGSAHSIRDNIYLNYSRAVNISINNTGGMTLNMSVTNSSGALFLATNSSYYINFTAQYPTTMAPGLGTFINITYMLNTTLTGNNQGSYRGWLFFNTSQNTDAANKSYPYQTFNLSIEINLSNQLDVNITRMIPCTSNVTVSNSNSSNITLRVVAALLNGTVISGNSYLLSATSYNFNSSSSNITSANVSTYYKDLTGTVRSFQAGDAPCSTGSNYCDVNVTIPTRTAGGTYNMSLPVRWDTGGGNLTGVGVNSTFAVNDTGLNISGATSTSFSVYETGTVYFNASVANYGNIAASGNLRMYIVSGSSYISSLTAYSNTAGCGTFTAGNNYFTITAPANTLCNFIWKIIATGVSSSTAVALNITAESDNAYYNLTGISLNILENSTSGDGTAPPTEPPPPANTYTHTINITSYEPVIHATLGATNSTTVTVRHIGNVSTMTVMLNATVGGISASVTPASYTLSPNNNGIFSVVFNVSNSTALGNHTGTFKAYESSDTGNYVTKSFTVVVLSTPERQSEINASYANCTADFANLTSEFSRIKASGLVPAANLTRAEALINETNSTINQIKTAIDSGDYAAAETLLTGLVSQLNRLRTELDDIQRQETSAAGEFWSSIWVWVVVAVIILGVIGLLIYMLLPPPEGFHAEYGYRPGGGGGLLQKIKDKIKGIFRRGKAGGFKGVSGEETKAPAPGGDKTPRSVPSYAEGYERHAGPGYAYKTKASAAGKLKGLFKRKRS